MSDAKLSDIIDVSLSNKDVERILLTNESLENDAAAALAEKGLGEKKNKRPKKKKPDVSPSEQSSSVSPESTSANVSSTASSEQSVSVSPDVSSTAASNTAVSTKNSSPHEESDRSSEYVTTSDEDDDDDGPTLSTSKAAPGPSTRSKAANVAKPTLETSDSDDEPLNAYLSRNLQNRSDTPTITTPTSLKIGPRPPKRPLKKATKKRKTRSPATRRALKANRKGAAKRKSVPKRKNVDEDVSDFEPAKKKESLIARLKVVNNLDRTLMTLPL